MITAAILFGAGLTAGVIYFAQGRRSLALISVATVLVILAAVAQR